MPQLDQVDDMGRSVALADWMQQLADDLERGVVPTKEDRGRLRQAAGHLRTFSQERRAMAEEVTAARAELHAEAMRVRNKPPTRERLPEERVSVTRKFDILTNPGEKPYSIYITPGMYPDGRLGEVFLKCDNPPLGRALLDALSITVSLGLQYGIPLSVFTDKFIGTRFEPDGFTGDAQYKTCTSMLDLIFRWLKDRYIPPESPPSSGNGVVDMTHKLVP